MTKRLVDASGRVYYLDQSSADLDDLWFHRGSMGRLLTPQMVSDLVEFLQLFIRTCKGHDQYSVPRGMDALRFERTDVYGGGFLLKGQALHLDGYLDLDVRAAAELVQVLVEWRDDLQ
jgi:hypothetical protein